MGYLKAALAFMFAAGLVMYPKECASAALTAMNTWATSVAPALFPFAAVMPFITCDEARNIYERIFGRITQRLFRLPGGTASAIVIGFLSGSPAGALAVARVAEAERLTKGETARLAGIVCGVSPVYMISVLGTAMNGSAAVGWRLAGAQMMAQIAAGVLLRKMNFGSEMAERLYNKNEGDRPVASATNAVLRVCGHMALFSVGINMVSMVFGDNVLRFAAFADLPSGVQYCKNTAVLAAAAGFGGACICVQNLSVLKGMVKVWVYITHKVITSILCAAFFMMMGNVRIRGFRTSEGLKSMLFEKNLLLAAAIILIVLLFYAVKQTKKHFS